MTAPTFNDLEIRYDGMAVMLNVFSVVTLLRGIEESAGTHTADALAQELLDMLAAPHAMGPRIWRWLTEYGIAPEKINEITSALPDMR